MDITGSSEYNSDSSSIDQVKKMKPLEYIRDVNVYLTQGNYESAYAVIQAAYIEHPEDPYVLSFCGYLQAIVGKRYRNGVDKCTKAIEIVEKSEETVGSELLFPLLYLNLGKAYAAAGRRTSAIIAFSQGLHYDPHHAGILQDMKKLGMRTPPPIPFLDRSNPINKFLGKALYKKKKQKQEGKLH
jgi:tetratricopeptide (TPR) repeat protein